MQKTRKSRRVLLPEQDKTVPQALAELIDLGVITTLVQHDVDAWAVGKVGTWNDLAQFISGKVRHLVWPSTRRATLRNGGGKNVFLFDPKDLEKITDARETLEGMGLEPSWSIPHMARELLKVLGDGQFCDGTENIINVDGGIGYHEVRPGWYNECAYYDISGCYFQLLCRAKSLGVDLHRDSISWHGIDRAQWERWQWMCHEIKDCKPLRNALWGAMLGGEAGAPRRCYLQGKMEWRKMPAGKFRALACLVGRSAWEVCREAAIETDTPHAHTDAVLCVGDVMPRTWDRLGIAYKLDKSGTFHIQGPGAYSCNGHPTGLYDRDMDVSLEFPRAPQPHCMYHRIWL